MKTKYILTCEHATNYIPEKYKKLFRSNSVAHGPWGIKKIGYLLNEHWGFDLGALTVAKELKKSLNLPLFTFPVSRLFIEGNRYRQSSLFSSIMTAVDEKEKAAIIKHYWAPHIKAIEKNIQHNITLGKQTIHIGVHSFTPERNGVVRKGDIGILFNPKRPSEQKFARSLQNILHANLPSMIIRRNYPYTGYSEGLAMLLRKKFSDKQYVGIEIEINNKFIQKPSQKGKAIIKILAESLSTLRS